MRGTNLTAGGMLAACLLFAAGARAEEAKVASPAPKPAQAKPAGVAAMPSEKEIMEAIEKAGAPGPQHAALKSMAGSWKSSVKMWMGPGEPQVSEGSSESVMILGDRYLKQDDTGSFMGHPFQGLGIMGYDNLEKKYVMSWVDTAGTGIMTASGTADPGGKSYTFKGTMIDATTGKPTKYKETVRVIDENTHVFEMYGWHGGKEVKEMEITYTRK